MKTRLAAIALAGALAAGCAGTMTELPEPSPTDRVERDARAAAFDAHDRERTVAKDFASQKAAVDPVIHRILPAARAVCLRQQVLEAAQCEERMESIDVSVDTSDEEVNAYAAPDGRIWLTGGLAPATGNDDEVALVLAHEVGHVLYAHGDTKKANARKGGWIGAGLGALAGVGAYLLGMDEEDAVALGAGLGAVRLPAHAPGGRSPADPLADLRARGAKRPQGTGRAAPERAPAGRDGASGRGAGLRSVGRIGVGAPALPGPGVRSTPRRNPDVPGVRPADRGAGGGRRGALGDGARVPDRGRRRVAGRQWDGRRRGGAGDALRVARGAAMEALPDRRVGPGPSP